MTYLSKLRGRRKTPAAVWHKLRTSISTDKFDFFVAFEGEEDEEFYSKHLSARFPDKRFRPLICDGKGGVLGLHSEVLNAWGSAKNVFFFIDADHDRLIGIDEDLENTFVTCGYAVENYIYDDNVVLPAIDRLYQLNNADDLRGEISRCWHADCHVFEVRASTVMSYLLALRRSNQDPNLDRVNFNAFFAYQDGVLEKKTVSCNDLVEWMNVDRVEIRLLLETMRETQRLEKNAFFRGKMLAQFIISFFRNLPKRFDGREKLNGKPLKPKTDLGKANFIASFLDFTDCPDRLTDFFDTMEHSF